MHSVHLRWNQRKLVEIQKEDVIIAGNSVPTCLRKKSVSPSFVYLFVKRECLGHHIKSYTHLHKDMLHFPGFGITTSSVSFKRSWFCSASSSCSICINQQSAHGHLDARTPEESSALKQIRPTKTSSLLTMRSSKLVLSLASRNHRRVSIDITTVHVSIRCASQNGNLFEVGVKIKMCETPTTAYSTVCICIPFPPDSNLV